MYLYTEFFTAQRTAKLTTVSKEWRSVIKTTEHTLALLPIMQRVPQRRDYSLPRIISRYGSAIL